MDVEDQNMRQEFMFLISPKDIRRIKSALAQLSYTEVADLIQTIDTLPGAMVEMIEEDQCDQTH